MTGHNRMFMCVRLILLILVLAYGAAARKMKCEDLTIPLCQGLGYNITYMPNRFNHESQREAALEVHQFWPLVEIKCSAVLKFFLCSVYAPVCDKVYGKELLPCRSVCEHAKTGCFGVMQQYGFIWPEKMECDQWPEEKTGVLCMAPETPLPTLGSAQPLWPKLNTSGSPLFPKLSRPRPTGKQRPVSDHTSLLKPTRLDLSCKCSCQQPFVWTDRKIERSVGDMDHCALPCNASYFTDDQKQFATAWVTLWSTLCFVSTFLTLATFLLDTERFGYPERPVIFLSGCYLLLSFGYILRLIAGERAVICDENDHIAAETTGPALCTVVFLMTYFGAMTSALWWVILAFTWFLAAGMKWSNESIASVSQYFHIVAWLIPSVQTISILAMSSIDGDPLSGICYTGNQSKESLVVFVIVPLGIYLSIGTSFLVAGFVSLFRIRKAIRSDGNNTNKLEKLMIRIGVFSVLYTVPATVTIGCYFYEMTNRHHWEKSITCRECMEEHEMREPEFSAFMVKYFMSLVVGVSTGFWICSMKTVDSWKSILRRLTRGTLPRASSTAKDPQGTAPLRLHARTDV